MLREIEIFDKTVVLDHPDLASTLSNRAAWLRVQVRLKRSDQGKVVVPRGEDNVLDNRRHFYQRARWRHIAQKWPSSGSSAEQTGWGAGRNTRTSRESSCVSRHAP